jgi:hypothetical protein
VVVCFLLTAFLLQTAWSVAAASRRTAVRLLERSEALETERVGWHVLLAEVSLGVPERDWGPAQRTALPLRVFRGVGELCPGGGSPSDGLVRYRGIRLPEPEKDSLLMVDAAGSWRAVRLVQRASSEEVCGAWAGEAVERWSWDPPVTGTLLARVFERGSYHLEDRAVRYRLGAAGRQPLTPERLDDRASGFLEPVPGGIDLRMRLRTGDGASREWTRSLTRKEGGA